MRALFKRRELVTALRPRVRDGLPIGRWLRPKKQRRRRRRRPGMPLKINIKSRDIL